MSVPLSAITGVRTRERRVRLAFSLGFNRGIVTTNRSEALVSTIVEPAIAPLGYALVRVQIQGRQRPRLQVMVERADETLITLDDCARLSTVISALLDAHDPIAGSYVLEVSSPGVDRPLVRLQDFARFQGHVARIETARPIEGRKRFTGRLLGHDGADVRVEVAGETVALPFADIAKAKLVVTEELLAAHVGGATSAES